MGKGPMNMMLARSFVAALLALLPLLPAPFAGAAQEPPAAAAGDVPRAAPPEPAPAATAVPPAADEEPSDDVLPPQGGVSARSVARTNPRGEYGFFSLFDFNGSLVAGTYCGYRAQGLCGIYVSVPERPRLKRVKPPLNTGESVYALNEFRGRLYANTENKGKLFRSRDGVAWEEVFRDHGLRTSGGVMGGAVGVFDGQVWASFTELGTFVTRIYKSPSGDPGSWMPDQSFGTRRGVQIRELPVFNDRFYALGYDHNKNAGVIFAYAFGRGWEEAPFDGGGRLRNKRIVKAHPWKGWLYLSTSPWVNNKRLPPAEVWRWDGRSLENVYTDPKRNIGTDIADFGGRIYFADSLDWNATEGEAGLHRSPTGEKGTWTEIFSLPQPEAMDMAVHGGKLYVATRQRGGVGNVFEMVLP